MKPTNTEELDEVSSEDCKERPITLIAEKCEDGSTSDVRSFQCPPYCILNRAASQHFLQGGNIRQLANDGTNTMTLEDQVWRLQQHPRLCHLLLGRLEGT